MWCNQRPPVAGKPATGACPGALPCVQHIAAVIHDLPRRSNPSSWDAQKTPTQGKVMYTYEAQTNAVATQTKCGGCCTKLHKPIVTQKQGSPRQTWHHKLPISNIRCTCRNSEQEPEPAFAAETQCGAQALAIRATRTQYTQPSYHKLCSLAAAENCRTKGIEEDPSAKDPVDSKK